jgi:hypothetical protein
MSVVGPIFIQKPEGRILMVSPCTGGRKELLEDLAPQSLSPAEAAGGAEALLRLRENDFRALLLDPNIEDLNGES